MKRSDEMKATNMKDTVGKKELLAKIAEINGRYVFFPLFDDGLYQTVYRDGTDAFIGPLDKVIEWEKGYSCYLNSELREKHRE